ncbi:MAG: DUF3024 domain-containing protein [Zoogloea sp.]|nr:DUF3024 domain-containing protein [Zoogloea sp.]
MNAPAFDDAPGACASVVGPAEFLRRRLEKALDVRGRYRYVRPRVLPEEGGGWRVVSPCCSRNVDREGGEIDIAWFEPVGDGWRVYARNHEASAWVPYAHAPTLNELIDQVCADPLRIFWP